MNSVPWVGVCAVVALAIGCVSAPAFAQFGGGEQKAEQDSAPRSTDDETNSASPAIRCLCIDEGDPSRIAHIKQALRRPLVGTGLQFNDVPLEQVVASLKDQYDIELRIDTAALDDIGLGPDEPITVALQNISLRSALRLMLREIQLTYVIRDEVLVITTPDEAETELLLCIYDVRDLVQGQNADRGVKELMAAITSCIALDTWAVNKGGEAQIRPLHPGLLVVAQTRAIHEQIAELLASIRQLRGIDPASLTRASTRGRTFPFGGGGGGGGFNFGAEGFSGGFGYGGSRATAPSEATDSPEDDSDGQEDPFGF